MSQHLPEPSPSGLLEQLRRREGGWLDWAKACQSLQHQKMTPQAIFEATGLEPAQQNQMVVAAQVYEGMAKAGASAALLEHFAQRGSDILYELRILSPKDRIRVAELVVSRNLGAGEAHEIARAVKSYAQLQQLPEGFTDHPGDAVAYQAWKTAQQSRDLQERTRAIGRALQYVHSETARRQIEQLLTTLALGSRRKLLPRLSVFRPEEELPRLLPVAGSLPLATATWEGIPPAAPQGPFGWVSGAAGQMWIALPAWPALQRAADPVALQVENQLLGSLLDQPVAAEEEQDPVLLVVDRAVRTWEGRAGVFLVDREGWLSLEWIDEDLPPSPLLGQVLMAIRPPRIFDEEVAQDPWQLEE
jgi:hypothetical protein